MGVPDRWPNYSKVRFRSDQHRANGAPEGSVGYIVEVYDDAYEVEVTEPETGETLFLGAVPDAGLDLISGHGPVSLERQSRRSGSPLQHHPAACPLAKITHSGRCLRR